MFLADHELHLHRVGSRNSGTGVDVREFGHLALV